MYVRPSKHLWDDSCSSSSSTKSVIQTNACCSLIWRWGKFAAGSLQGRGSRTDKIIGDIFHIPWFLCFLFVFRTWTCTLLLDWTPPCFKPPTHPHTHTHTHTHRRPIEKVANSCPFRRNVSAYLKNPTPVAMSHNYVERSSLILL